MADPGDDRHRTRRNGSRHGLFVERPKVFEAATAPADYDHFSKTAGCEPVDGVGYLFGRTIALHRRRGHHHLEVGQSPQDLEHVLQGGPGGRCHDTDSIGQRRHGSFAIRREEPLGVESLLELLEGELEGADSLRFEGTHHELKSTALPVDGE